MAARYVTCYSRVPSSRGGGKLRGERPAASGTRAGKNGVIALRGRGAWGWKRGSEEARSGPEKKWARYFPGGRRCTGCVRKGKCGRIPLPGAAVCGWRAIVWDSQIRRFFLLPFSCHLSGSLGLGHQHLAGFLHS